MLRLPLWMLAASLLAGPVSAQVAAPDSLADAAELDRAGLVAAVLERNPSLVAARQALRAAALRPIQVSALDDLMVSYGVAPRSIGADVDFGQELEVGQRLPYPGKRRLRAKAAAADADAAGADADSLALELASRAVMLFDDYYLIERAREINAEHVALVDDLKQVATARYAAGLASQQDPLQAESELAHLIHDGIELRSERQVVRSAINALLHRGPDAPLAEPPRELEPPAAPAGEALLEAEALGSRPELKAGAAAVLSREAELELARLTGRPDFGVMAAYNSMWSDGEHRLMVGGSVSVPVWRARVRAGVAEAEARLQQARSELAALEDEVRHEVRQASERRREAHHILELFRSRLLPPALDQVQAALAGFTTGTNDFLALIEAERNLRRVKLDYHETLAKLDREQALLELAVGRLPGARQRPASIDGAAIPGEVE